MNEIRRLKSGMAVSDIGHQPIGRVESVSDNAFKLDVWGDGAVWLREDALFWVGVHGATLVCDGSRIERYSI